MFIYCSGLFFRFRERLHCRIPAALGFVCGLLRRVGGSAVFHEDFYFFFFFCQHIIVHFLSKFSCAFFCQNPIWLFLSKFSCVTPLSIFANFRLFLLEYRSKPRQIYLNIHQISPVTSPNESECSLNNARKPRQMSLNVH
jgi:hypothetical protein